MPILGQVPISLSPQNFGVVKLADWSTRYIVGPLPLCAGSGNEPVASTRTYLHTHPFESNS